MTHTEINASFLVREIQNRVLTGLRNIDIFNVLLATPTCYVSHGLEIEIKFSDYELFRDGTKYIDFALDEAACDLQNKIIGVALSALQKPDTIISGYGMLQMFATASGFCRGKAIAFVNPKCNRRIRKKTGSDFAFSDKTGHMRNGYVVTFGGVNLYNSKQVDPSEAVGGNPKSVNVYIGEIRAEVWQGGFNETICRVFVPYDVVLLDEFYRRTFKILLDAPVKTTPKQAATTNCVNCGAPLHGTVCDYCGTEYKARFELW